jgi:lipoprotein-anchoring transpeptidase ErfK/SrfK
VRAAVSAGVVCLAVALGLIGRAVLDGGGGATPATPLTRPVGGGTGFSLAAAEAGRSGRGVSVVARSLHARIGVYSSPAAGRPRRRLARRIVEGHRLPLVFLVLRRRGSWLRVQLPTRPNLSTAWIQARDVTLAANPYRIAVRLRAHQLAVYREGRRVAGGPIGVGRAVSPTPRGRYFVTDLLKPPDPRGFYGPYALGLSAHSPIYTSFEGGDGQVGIHGTNQPAALGTDVSHGCIRVRNELIRRIARMVPLGTPVSIQPA